MVKSWGEIKVSTRHGDTTTNATTIENVGEMNNLDTEGMNQLLAR